MKPTLLLALVATACAATPPRPAPASRFGAQVPCARLAVAWRDHDARHVSPATYWRDARAFIERALTCQDPELAFAGFMIGPRCGDAPACRRPDGSHLAHLERAGVPLKAAFAAWLANRDLGPLGASLAYCSHEPYRSIQETSRWLARSGYREFAPALASIAMTQHDPYVQAALLDYFTALGLREGEPIARGLLAHRDPALRQRACQALTRFGSTTALPAVRALAARDGHSRLQVIDGIEQEVYPVRIRCAEAVDALTHRTAARVTAAR